MASKTHAPTVDPTAASAAGSQGAPKTVDPSQIALDGLFVAGQLIGRQRREFQSKGGATRYAITLTILTKTGVHKPERWSDTPAPSDVPTVGEHVVLPVTVTLYQSKNGTGYRMVWGPTQGGEEF